MASVNKVILVGNLGADPEVRYTASSQAIATINIATTERWKNKTTGQPEEKTEWHRVVLFGRLAELARDYLAKGRSVYIEGRLQTRKWEDKQGQVRYTTEIVAQMMQFLGSAGGGASRDRAAEPAVEVEPNTSSSTNEPPPFNADDDIPF